MGDPEGRQLLLVPKNDLEAMLPKGASIVGIRYDLGTEDLEIYVRGMGPTWQEGYQPWAIRAHIVPASDLS